MAREDKIFHCALCQESVVMVPCYDGNKRLFETVPKRAVDEPARPIWDRWVVARRRGMVNVNDVTTTHPTYYVLHRCYARHIAYGDSVLATASDARPRGGLPETYPPGLRIGYRWLGGPAHVARQKTGRGLCGANADYGATDRERERAQYMPACERCLARLTAHLGEHGQDGPL